MKYIATDLDRTLFPNGEDEREKNDLEDLKKLLEKNNVKLIYVTGRYKNLVEEGIKEFNPPLPEYVVCDVGTVIYKYEDGKFLKDDGWEEFISKDWKGRKRSFIIEVLNDIKDLKLQEEIKQNNYKQSYYIKSRNDSVLNEIRRRLKFKGLSCEVIYSFDVNENTGLIDVLPRSATKLGALNYLVDKLNLKKENVIYAGDSGNDLLPLTAGYKGVLVNNASDDLKKELKGLVFISSKNYAAGVIEGAKHYKFFK